MKPVKLNGCNSDPKVAVILAGGKSKRFGSDKALAKLNGKSLIEILTQILKKSGFEVVICGAEKDPLPGEGPLQALYGTLLQLNCPKLLLVACDMPLVEQRVIKKLWEESQDSDITLLEFQGKTYPLPGVYSKTVIPYIKHLLIQSRRDLKCLFETNLKIKILPESHWQSLDPNAKSIYNINTLKDLDLVKTSPILF